MEEYFLYLINNFSLEIFLISLAIFGVTMLIKIPIKKATNHLAEAQRQGINTVIMLVPLVLAFVASAVYFWITGRPIISLGYLSYSLSTCIMSITIYLIFARLAIIIKGLLLGKTKIEVADMENAVVQITEVLESKRDPARENLSKNEEITQIREKINTLLSFRQKLEQESGVQNITALTETNNEIKLLEEQAKLLEN